MARAIITALLCLVAGTYQQALAQTLGQSNQNFMLTGVGANSSGDGVSQVTYGDCSYDGTNTNCTLSGSFTGLGSGGTYDFVLSYPGNGASPLTAITTPGSDLFTFRLTSGSFTYTFNESNGTTLKFNKLDYDIYFVPGQTTCTGSPSDCAPGAVGTTPGATETGPVTGTFALAPVIQTVISASAYGGFTFIAPATWIEIYGQNLATTTVEWSGSNFDGNKAPTSLGGTTVTVGGIPAFTYYVSPSQVNVQVPSGVALGSQQVIVTTAAGASAPFSRTVNTTEPGILAPSSFLINGKQYAVAQFSDGFYDLPPGTDGVAARRAVPGDVILLYGIGFGTVTPDTLAGVIATDTSKLNSSIDISIGGATAPVQYAGLTPGFVGLYQFNVQVPNIPPSDVTPLTFTLGGTAATQTLYLFVGQ